MAEDGLVAGDATLVSSAENVLVVVRELLAADSADNVVGTRFRFFKEWRVLLMWERRLEGLLEVFKVLLV